MTIVPDLRIDRVGLVPTGVRLLEGGPFMDTSHVSALQLKHAGLEKQLQDEMSRPMPDNATIQDLKKRKLRIKEELSQH